MVAKVLGVPRTRSRSRSAAWAAASAARRPRATCSPASPALVAKKTGRAAKIRPDRDDDMIVTGKRHDFVVDYEVGFDDDGRIQGLDMTYAARCGWSADLSGPVTDRALFHADNCYYLPAVELRSLPLKTNTVSNTAFRGFGGPQGMVGGERVIEEIAFALGLDPLEVRKRNFYGTGRAQRHALPPDGRGQRHPPSWWPSWRAAPTTRPPRGDPRVQRGEPGAQARHRADAGQVRHLVHAHRLQPGRRAGARLHRRQRAPEPRRHRDGAGPLHQGRAGGGRGVPDRPRPGADHRDHHRQGAEHLGDRRLLGHRPQRQAAQAAAARSRAA